MSEQLLDFWEQEESFYKGKIITVKYFYLESQAIIYASRLKELGIKTFISNTNTTTAFPIGNGGIGLHVREADRDLSLKIIKKLDRNNARDNHNLSFHDADHEDIAYQQALSQQKHIKEPILLLIFIILSLLLFKIFIQSKGLLY